MKKTIIVLFALSGVAMAAEVGSVSFTGGSDSYESGATFGQLQLKSAMTTGQGSGLGIEFTPSVEIYYEDAAWQCANDYTVSIWVDTDSLTQDRVLFGYCGAWSSNAKGYNGLTWNASAKTLTLGKGEYKRDPHTFTIAGGTTEGLSHSTTSSSLESLLTNGMTNFTLAVGSTTKGKMTADLWVNGVHIETLDTYAGDMSGNITSMKYFVDDGQSTYGTISLTNEKLTTASAVASLAGAKLVPEPATATLSLLALAGLAARRRRK